MKKKVLLFAGIVSAMFSIAQAPVFEWAKKAGGLYNDEPKASVADKDGNIYTTGCFSGTADFDPNPSNYNLSSNGGTDIFISKLNSNGDLLWAIKFGSEWSDTGISITVDDSANIYTTGFFQGRVDFDPGAGVSNVTVVNYGIYILKLDRSGNFIWAKPVSGYLTASSIKTDAHHNVYVGGSFYGKVDFDPGPTTYSVLPSHSNDAFVLKLNSEGSFEWVKITAVGGISHCNAMAVDSQGNIYSAGDFGGTVDFDPAAATYTMAADYRNVFISKLDPSGKFVWAKKMGGARTHIASAITIDASDNMYVAGNFEDNGDFDPGQEIYILSPEGYADVFIVKLDAHGKFTWAKSIGGAYGDFCNSITTDALGNVYTTGSFSGRVDFDPGKATHDFNAGENSDVFILKLDPEGNFGWAKQLGGGSTDVGNSVCTDALGNVYTVGQFSIIADFDPGQTVYNLTSEGSADIFIHKLSQCSSLNPAITASSSSSMICIGQTATLTASGANTYSWSNGFIGSSQTISPLAATVYTVTGTNGRGCSNVGMVNVLADPCLGLNELKTKEQGLRIWPNPGTEFLNIELNGNNSETVSLQISNLFGQVVLDEKFENNESSYNISHLPVGIYFVTVTSDKKQNGFKLVKQ